MELPAALRGAADRELAGASLSDLQRAADRLSERYRGQVHDGRLHLSNEAEARAYLATRLPATYAALRDALGRAADACPLFSPTSLLDVGAGPGTALWAASDCWGGIADATLIEASPAIRAVGERLAADASVARVQWRAGDATRSDVALDRADLVTLGYTLNELSAEAGLALVARLWNATAGMLIVVEPGTPAGWQRILAVRQRLIAAGASIVAPCAHHAPCPLRDPDWCHFSRRVARSRLHRLAKRGDVGWEDEKYIYLAASRTPTAASDARVLSPPRGGGGKIELKLCCNDGAMRQQLVTRRDRDDFAIARRVDWGDAVPARLAGSD